MACNKDFMTPNRNQGLIASTVYYTKGEKEEVTLVEYLLSEAMTE